MLDISCPGVYPGVLLWPICHPYMKALAPSRVENAPLTARLSLLFYFVRVDSDRHFSESMVLASLSPPSLELVHSLGDPLLSRSSVCSSFRPVKVTFLLIAVASGVLRTWVVPGPLCPGLHCPPYDPKLKMSLATRRGHSSCCGSLRSVPGLG